MESIIARKAKEARDKSAMMGRGAGFSGGEKGMGTGGFSGGSGGEGNPLGLGVGGGSYGFGYKRTDMTQHLEQYRHNSGWVAASIGPIGKRIARQAVRLAVVKAAPTGKEPSKYGTKAVQGSIQGTGAGRLKLKPWERSKDNSAAELWFKGVLPGSFKTVAASADLIDGHPVLDAIEDPNPIMVRWSMMFVTVASLMLTGKSYWWVKARERDADDTPVLDGSGGEPKIDIWPLPSHWVRPVHTAEKLNDHWEVTPDGALEPTPVPREQIVFFSFPDPSAILASQSPLQNQSRAVVSDEAIAEAQRRAFANGVFPGLAVIVGRQPGVSGEPGDRPALTREQRAQIVTAIKQAYRGVYQADEPIILDRLIEDVKRITNTAREMDFMQSGKYTKERITQGFGVNPIVMGEVEGANRASSATADDHLCQSTVNPIIELISQTLTKWLNSLFATPGEKLYLFIEEARAIDPDSDRADWEALFDRGACSRDELRAGLRQLPPMVNGDTGFIASGFVSVDCRLAAEAAKDKPKPVLPLAPQPGNSDDGKPPQGGGNPVKPSANGDGTGGTGGGGEPAQNSEASVQSDVSGATIADFVDTLAKMAKRKFLVQVARPVLFSIFFGIPGRKIERALNLCSVDGKGEKLRELGVIEICEVAKLLRKDEIDALQNPADTRSEIEIPVRDFRQKMPFDCGAAVGYTAADALGYKPESYGDFLSQVRTEEQFGTKPEDLEDWFSARGGNATRRDRRTIEYIRAELRKGRLCLCPVQYFGDGDKLGGEGGEVEDGHWVIINGYTRDGLKYQCPIDGPGHIDNAEFLHNWYDRDQNGVPYVRLVVAVGQPPAPTVDTQAVTGIKPEPEGSHNSAKP